MTKPNPSAIRRAWDKADQLAYDAEALRWRVARMLAEANDAEISQAALADATGRGETTVRYYIAVAREFGARDLAERPTWTEAMESVAPQSAAGPTRLRAARRVLREQPEALVDEIADATKRLPRDERTKVGQAIFDRDRADHEADPDARRATKHAKDRDHQLDARQSLSKALWALRARLDFYGDVPLDDFERERVAIIRVLLERLEAGLAMDDELAAMLEGVEG